MEQKVHRERSSEPVLLNLTLTPWHLAARSGAALAMILTFGRGVRRPIGAVHPRFSNERHFPYRASFSGQGDKNLSRSHLLYWPFGIGGFGQLR